MSKYVVKVIVDFPLGSKVKELALAVGAPEVHILQGRGTVRRVKDRRDGSSASKKDVVLLSLEENLIADFYSRLTKGLNLEEDNTGIAFSEAMEKVAADLEAVYLMVPEGFAEEVIQAGSQVGCGGATILMGFDHTQARQMALPMKREEETVLMVTSGVKRQALLEEVALRCPEVMAFSFPVVSSLGIKFY